VVKNADGTIEFLGKINDNDDTASMPNVNNLDDMMHKLHVELANENRHDWMTKLTQLLDHNSNVNIHSALLKLQRSAVLQTNRTVSDDSSWISATENEQG